MSERPWMDAELSADRRASLLLEEMTSEEKVALMTGDVLEGVEGFSNAGIDRLGIPPLRMADAGSGLRRPAGYSAATAMPAPIALAATWDADLGTPYGYVVARSRSCCATTSCSARTPTSPACRGPDASARPSGKTRCSCAR